MSQEIFSVMKLYVITTESRQQSRRDSGSVREEQKDKEIAPTNWKLVFEDDRDGSWR